MGAMLGEQNDQSPALLLQGGREVCIYERTI